MNKLLFIILSVFPILACTKSGVIEFCTDINKTGEGIKCGKKFSTGEMKIIINSETSFGTGKLQINKTDLTNTVYLESRMIKVDPAATKANSELSFYKSGKYRISALKENKEMVAQGDIEIIEDVEN